LANHPRQKQAKSPADVSVPARWMKNNAKLCHAGGARDDQRPTDGDIDCQISQANTRWQMQPTAQSRLPAFVI